MKTKSEILLSLLKNGWILRIAWDREDFYLRLYVEVRSEHRDERVYTISHKENVYNLSLFKDVDHYMNYMELTLLNQLYDKMLIEEGYKVL